jgi:hypothetical protein
MKTLGVFHSTYYNNEQFKYSFYQFKKHFPESPYLIYSDMGDDFSEYVDENTYFKKSNIRYYGTGPKSIWLDNWDLWSSYYGRLRESCEICQTDYILVMEDDVLINKKFQIEEDFDFCGPCKAKLSPHILNFFSSKNIKIENPFYGLCGGAIFNAKKFLENYDSIINNLKMFHYEYSNNLIEPISVSPDGNFTIQFNLLGMKYECSKFMMNGDIIHPYPGYVRYIQ